MESLIYGLLWEAGRWAENHANVIEHVAAAVRRGWDKGSEKTRTIQEAWSEGGVYRDGNRPGTEKVATPKKSANLYEATVDKMWKEVRVTNKPVVGATQTQATDARPPDDPDDEKARCNRHAYLLAIARLNQQLSHGYYSAAIKAYMHLAPQANVKDAHALAVKHPGYVRGVFLVADPTAQSNQRQSIYHHYSGLNPRNLRGLRSEERRELVSAALEDARRMRPDALQAVVFEFRTRTLNKRLRRLVDTTGKDDRAVFTHNFVCLLFGAADIPELNERYWPIESWYRENFVEHEFLRALTYPLLVGGVRENGRVTKENLVRCLLATDRPGATFRPGSWKNMLLRLTRAGKVHVLSNGVYQAPSKEQT